MEDKNDWRLSTDAEYLKNKYINPTDGEEIIKYAPYLKACFFCLEKVLNSPYQRWYMPENMSCCICEKCFDDFKEMFQWKKLDGWDFSEFIER